MKLAGLNALAALGLAATSGPKLPNSTIGADKAKLTRETFGDLRIYRQGLRFLPPRYRIGVPVKPAANSATLALGASGEIVTHVDQPTGTVDLVIDVNCYFQ